MCSIQIFIYLCIIVVTRKLIIHVQKQQLEIAHSFTLLLLSLSTVGAIT